MTANALRVSRAAAALDCSPATIWNLLNADKLAFVRCGGMTLVVNEWGENPPPREGRAPSIAELLRERALAPQPPKRVMPEGVHRGRPRKTEAE